MSSTIDPRLNPALNSYSVETGHEHDKQQAVQQGVGIPDNNDDDVVPQHGHAGSGKASKGGKANHATLAKGALGAVHTGGVDSKKVQALALAGLSPTDADSVQRGTSQSNKYSSDSSVLQSQAPLPPDAPIPNARSQQLFSSMNQDVQGVLGATQAPADQETKAGIGQIGAALSQMIQAPANSPQQRAAQQKLAQGTTSLTNRIGQMMSSLASGDGLALFCLLAVENKSSGKEVQSAMQDLLTQGRNNAIGNQVNEQKAAADKAAAARKKAELLKKLGPIIDLIVTAIALAITALTAGTMGPVMFAMAAAVTGFMVGGIAGGAKNHDGFDLGAAATGAGIGAAIVGPAKLAIELALKLVMKLAIMTGIKEETKEAATEGVEQGIKQIAQASAKEVAKNAESAAQKSAVDAEKFFERGAKMNKKHNDEMSEAASKAKPTNQSDDSLPQKGRATTSRGTKSLPSSLSDTASEYAESLRSLPSDVASRFKNLGGDIKEGFADLKKNPIDTLKRSWNENSYISQESRDNIAARAEARAAKGEDYKEAYRAEVQAHSSRINKAASIAQGAMQISNQITQAVQNYTVNMMQADSKELQANAKQWKVVADQLQDTWQNIQDTLSNLMQNHSQVVNQATQMLNSHNQANNNAVANIAR